jgi:hypothetical protein
LLCFLTSVVLPLFVVDLFCDGSAFGVTNMGLDLILGWSFCFHYAFSGAVSGSRCCVLFTNLVVVGGFVGGSGLDLGFVHSYLSHCWRQI